MYKKIQWNVNVIQRGNKIDILALKFFFKYSLLEEKTYRTSF